MNQNLLIVFAKNKLYGKVKTRLAKTIGNQSAFEVYEKLYHITEKETCAVTSAVVEVHYSHEIDHAAWKNCEKFVQQGEDLGERMKRAFQAGFEKGYTRIIGVGADLPEITTEIIEKAFAVLENEDFVFGPAEDGGYYLVGLNQAKGVYIFENKPWSTPELMDLTRAEINDRFDTAQLLRPLNDIDTIEDLARSCIAEDFAELIAQAKG